MNNPQVYYFTLKNPNEIPVQTAFVKLDNYQALKEQCEKMKAALEELKLYAEYRPTDVRVNKRIMIIHRALAEYKKWSENGL